MRESVANYILEVEGGFADNPKDPGGRTNYGITANTLAGVRGRLKGLALPEDVKDLTKEQALAIYEHFYWKPAGCDDIPRPIDLVVFDGCVNCGVRQGVKFLQQALNLLGEKLTVDGIFGSKTKSAVWNHAFPKSKVPSTILWCRAMFYNDIVKRKPDQRVFLHGWLNRLTRLWTCVLR
jgi:lysozyme family protein